jgi:cell division protein FtsB
MLKKLKKNYFLLVSTFLILYFFFNLLSGQRGLISYFEKKKILNNLQNKEFLLKKQIKDLDFKNSLLSDNLDLDYIESLIRERLLFGKKNETIYIIKNNDTKN